MVSNEISDESGRLRSIGIHCQECRRAHGLGTHVEDLPGIQLGVNEKAMLQIVDSQGCGFEIGYRA
jgi:hypothetical protein